MNQLDEFYKLKPKITTRQVSLLYAFNRLSQERRSENGAPLKIRDRDIHYYQRYNGSHGYASDLFVIAIRDLDQEYIQRRCDEISLKNEEG